MIQVVINDLGLEFPDGMNENQNPYVEEIRARTNLNVQFVLPLASVYEEKLNVYMSQEKRPDMLHVYNPVWLDRYMKAGELIPLDDLLKEHGQELLKKIPKEAWKQVTYEGHIYAIPSLHEIKGVELMYARNDWLDRLGLKPPTTLEEYAEVIRAFKEDDPDGNGLQDTTGLILTENLGRSAPFFGAFGTQLDSWIVRDGRLAYGSLVPEAKEAIAFLRKLYQEQLLDQEFPLNRHRNLESKVVEGTVGLFSAAWYDTRGMIAESKRRNPHAEWIVLNYPTGPDGANGVYSEDLIRGYNVIPTGTKRAAEVIQLLNYIAGDGAKVLKLGFENQVWQMIDGKIKTNFEEHDKHLYRGIYQSLVNLQDPVLDKQRLDSLGNYQLHDNLKYIEQHLILNAFQGMPTPAMNRLSMKPMDLYERFVRIIVGVDALDAFDQVAEEWLDSGGREVTREVNAWYRQQQWTNPK
ncbi:extracellular solute-binding protein [Paenibacillus sp. 1001270B_150601_E10]|uniref:extracellular solute-binding protein n=1 Tax=Paenibacillus sp. 1001270B_150601_E10 TaxID=2787079 RepID=UPI002B4BB425|nr:extracellular solute-binding protein [Paenibacillus sp. 1001270B_150601_E10]